jgi:hypothetical protein
VYVIPFTVLSTISILIKVRDIYLPSKVKYEVYSERQLSSPCDLEVRERERERERGEREREREERERGEREGRGRERERDFGSNSRQCGRPFMS